MPGYTHLQRAQPVTVGHHLLAWVEMLERDLRRFAAAADAADESPLGAGALAGSTLPLPAPANQLRNSLDAVADRDFALDYLYAAAPASSISHASARSSCSGRRPSSASPVSAEDCDGLVDDAAEAEPRRRRARARQGGPAIGRLTGLLATVKGLPLAYNRDLQEDKPPVFAARADLRGALGALTALVRRARARSRAARRRRPPTRCCWRRTRQRRSCATACLFATRTSRSPASVRDGTFEAAASRHRGLRRGRVGSARRSLTPAPLLRSSA